MPIYAVLNASDDVSAVLCLYATQYNHHEVVSIVRNYRNGITPAIPGVGMAKI